MAEWELVGFEEENGIGISMYDNNDLYVWRKESDADFDEIVIVSYVVSNTEDERFEVIAIDDGQVMLFREFFESLSDARDEALKFMGFFDEDE